MQNKLKITIIGAGSSYTPELIEGLFENITKLPVSEIMLMDIDEKRLNIMHGFCNRYVNYLGYDVAINSTTSRIEAVKGASFIVTQIRVGGNKARVNDEKIPLSYGLIGQETTGAGGFMKGLRTIPVMLDIAHDVEKYAPDAWIINYTNPTGLIAEAVNKYSNAKIAGLCAGGLFPRDWTAKALDVMPEQIKYNYIGLNHMNFGFDIKVDGKKITKDELTKIAKSIDVMDVELIEMLGVLPSPYLYYYFHTSKKLKELENAELTRGEEVQLLEKDIFAEYADIDINTKPKSLEKRGGGGYSDIALDVMRAIYNDEEAWIVCNVPNMGAIKFLPDDVVIETGCIVNGKGITPIKIDEFPKSIWGLISSVKNYEQLAVEAAYTGNEETALLALVAHPLIRDYDIVKPLLKDLMKANKDYLPQFYNKVQ